MNHQTIPLDHLTDERRRYRNSRSVYEPPEPPTTAFPHEIDYGSTRKPGLVSTPMQAAWLVGACLAGLVIIAGVGAVAFWWVGK